MVLITIVNVVYKPTYNYGAPSCKCSRKNSSHEFPSPCLKLEIICPWKTHQPQARHGPTINFGCRNCHMLVASLPIGSMVLLYSIYIPAPWILWVISPKTPFSAIRFGSQLSHDTSGFVAFRKQPSQITSQYLRCSTKQTKSQSFQAMLDARTRKHISKTKNKNPGK